MIKKKKYFSSGIIVLLILLMCFIGFLGSSVLELKKENQLYKIILRADKDFSKVSLDEIKANQYYDEASYSYENQAYTMVESNCRLARDYYLETSQGYKSIKAELKATEIEDNLIYIYIDILDAMIEVTNNMFEACEHFESAVRYYNTYFNTDVPYDDRSYDMGGKAIDSMNEKIRAHDKAIEEYNQYLEDFRVELEKRLK